MRPADVIERNLRLGLEGDILGHLGLAATGIVFGPGLRQIQPIRHRQARIMTGKRQRHRDLAIRLLAELTAVLVRNSNRMLPLLGKARVVDDPRLDRPITLNLRQHHLTHLAKHRIVGPVS